MAYFRFHYGLWLCLTFICAMQALRLDTFGGQAEANLLMNKVVGASDNDQRMMLMQATSAADQDYTCSKTKGCKLGCCGPLDEKGAGVCGMGPKFCGPGCTSQCDAKSECDPGWGIQWSNASTCPLNVCCSDYGFCGTTTEFCNGRTIPNPDCPVSAKSASKKLIGYYEGWNYQRPCGHMEPDKIPLGYYTHINFAFALIHPKTFRMDIMDEGTASRYLAVTSIKDKDPNLEVWIAIGGWAMNDPGPWRTAFSDMARSEANQDKFFDSLITFMKKYGFDGVDLDWEYPVADDRGGVEDDFKAYTNLLRRLRARLNQEGRKYGISITLPASYWYLRGFDLINMEPYLDWFNIMTYDIHGIWDSKIKSLGPYAGAHTNLTEIDQGLNLLWRNNINPERVVMGLGFYGRSFTMKDPSCMDAGCEFSDAAKGGECTGTPGVLSAAEIRKIIDAGAKVRTDETAAVKIVTWDTNQWVSWDDEATLLKKMDYAHKRCLGGAMVWAVDLDDGTLIDALGKAAGRKKKDVLTPSPFIECFRGDLK